MPRRALLFFLFLFGLAPASRSADAVVIKIRQWVLENTYGLGNSPSLVSFDVRNTTMQSIPMALLVDEVSLVNDARSVTPSTRLPLQLSPGEERPLRVPLDIVAGDNRRLVIYLHPVGPPISFFGGPPVSAVLKPRAPLSDLLCPRPNCYAISITARFL